MELIRSENLSYRVGQRTLVDQVQFTLAGGMVTAVLGPNGAGKSTLLKLLCRQLTPSAGRVLYAGKPLEDWDARALARQRAVLPQHSVVPFRFTASEIVLLGRAPHGDGSRCDDLALTALERTDCLHLKERTVDTLSGGELQRVHLARVLVQLHNPDRPTSRCLMLDEPTSSLDLAHQHGTLRVCRELAAEGVAVLVVLHDLNLAAQYADRLVVMRDGRIAAEGLPEEVLQPELVGEIFKVKAEIRIRPGDEAPSVFVARQA